VLVAVVEKASAVLVVAEVTAEPPFELNETVSVFALHLA
jgi:hypothetical protein